MSGVIAIVGRPNVGKSALFNRIVGRRIAIVHDQPGVTRDRISAEAEWRGCPLTLIDTGGIGLLRGEKSDNAIVRATMDQADLAVAAAQIIILVVNIRDGVTPLDHEVATRLRRAGKPVLLAVNKADHPGTDTAVPEFAVLGFNSIFPVSAIHGRGLHPLLDEALRQLPAQTKASPDASPTDAAAGAPTPDTPLKLAVVGRPNVGKSSLINGITHSDRVIVSPIPGTTRDAIDVPFEVPTGAIHEKYLLIDTAGMRKTRQVDDSVEFFSVARAEKSIERCDIVVFVLDAQSGILEQDKKIADKIVAAKKGVIVVVNKWDLYAEAVRQARSQAKRDRSRPEDRSAKPRSTDSLADFGGWVKERLFFLDYAPVIFTSATEGLHLDRLLEAVRFVASQLKQQIPTALLNRTLHDAIERRQPVSSSGSRLKFFYATQVQTSPPTFLLFVNREALFSPAYEKYLQGELRRAFGFEGCPVVLVPRPRPTRPHEKHRRHAARS